jgi:hypothetical protein
MKGPNTYQVIAIKTQSITTDELLKNEKKFSTVQNAINTRSMNSSFMHKISAFIAIMPHQNAT